MRDRLAPVSKAIILANVGVFGLQLLLGGAFEQLFAFWPPESRQGEFHVWQLLTYGFLHGGLVHLFFNMFAVFMFGSDIERVLGSKRFLFYYLTSVVGAAVMHLVVVASAQLPPAPVVGASGGVFGLLLAFGMMFPKRMVLLIFPPIPMPAWLFVTLYGIMELYLGVTQTAPGIAHFAHLGGMATGFALLNYWRDRSRR